MLSLMRKSFLSLNFILMLVLVFLVLLLPSHLVTHVGDMNNTFTNVPNVSPDLFEPSPDLSPDEQDSEDTPVFFPFLAPSNPAEPEQRDTVGMASGADSLPDQSPAPEVDPVSHTTPSPAADSSSTNPAVPAIQVSPAAPTVSDLSLPCTAPVPSTDTAALGSDAPGAGSSLPTNSAAPSPPRRPRTRLQDNIRKPKQYTDGTIRYGLLSDTREPSSLRDALGSPHWKAAMDLEYDALIKNGTWHLVTPQPGQNVVDCRWVWKVKEKADETIDRYKGRLVAKGYNQRYGLDYEDTFSPVVKAATIRLSLSLAVSKQWSIRQLDVQNAFLHGVLEEDVYM
jgi:hypothetical protein